MNMEEIRHESCCHSGYERAAGKSLLSVPTCRQRVNRNSFCGIRLFSLTDSKQMNIIACLRQPHACPVKNPTIVDSMYVAYVTNFHISFAPFEIICVLLLGK